MLRFARPRPRSSRASSARRAATATSPTRRPATGVSAGLPARMQLAEITSRRSIPIRNTAVGARASASQSSADDSFVGSSCPVAIATHDAWSRCVSGMPAYAGPAIADVTPGTISNGMPASASSSASSPPRPNTNGSPPLSRTTVRPVRACSISSSLMRCCPARALTRTLPDVDELARAARASEAPGGRDGRRRRRPRARAARPPRTRDEDRITGTGPDDVDDPCDGQAVSTQATPQPTPCVRIGLDAAPLRFDRVHRAVVAEPT